MISSYERVKNLGLGSRLPRCRYLAWRSYSVVPRRTLVQSRAVVQSCCGAITAVVQCCGRTTAAYVSLVCYASSYRLPLILVSTSSWWLIMMEKTCDSSSLKVVCSRVPNSLIPKVPNSRIICLSWWNHLFACLGFGHRWLILAWDVCTFFQCLYLDLNIK